MFGRNKKPKPKLPIVVKTYQHRKPKDAAKLFEKDAQEMHKQGYEVISVVGNDEKAGNLLLGGIGLLAPVTLTVTYRLSQAAAA